MDLQNATSTFSIQHAINTSIWFRELKLHFKSVVTCQSSSSYNKYFIIDNLHLI